jgi:ubiquinone/menaquinone biosynthesis C-methylase UbiE
MNSIYNTNFAHHYDLMYSWKNYAQETETIKQLIAQHTKNNGKRLLEVACGTGNYLQLLQTNFTLTGVDISADMLAVAAAKLPNIPLVQADMQNFCLNQTFDVLLCLFSSIAYLKNYTELQQTLQNFYQHLAVGGVAIIEAFINANKYNPNKVHALYIDTEDVKLSRHSTTHLQDNVLQTTMHTLVTTKAGVEYFVEEHFLNLFEEQKVVALMQAIGFEVIVIPNGLMPDRNLYICKKQKQKKSFL